MTTYKKLYSFMKKRYKAERFESRNNIWPKKDGLLYSECIVKGALETLKENGMAFIDNYESITGAAVCFDENLKIIPQNMIKEKIAQRYGR